MSYKSKNPLSEEDTQKIISIADNLESLGAKVPWFIILNEDPAPKTVEIKKGLVINLNDIDRVSSIENYGS